LKAQNSPLARLAASVEGAAALVESLRADVRDGKLPSYCPAEAFDSRRYDGWLAEAAASLKSLEGFPDERSIRGMRAAFLALQRVLRAADWLLIGERSAWSARNRDGVTEPEEPFDFQAAFAREAAKREPPEREARLGANVARYRSLARSLRELSPALADAPLSALLKEIDLAESQLYDNSVAIRDLATPILTDALRRGADEIRFEPGPWRALAEFRIDGDRRPMFELARTVHGCLTIRLKLLTNTMDITERKKPQEGELTAAGARFALRIEPSDRQDTATLRVLERPVA
jgi:type II secretory ATPase GspE/PulE/Tfp pilus assembly ATPase PilB-like protein